MNCELVVNAFQCLDQVTWLFAGKAFLCFIMFLLALGAILMAWGMRK